MSIVRHRTAEYDAFERARLDALHETLGYLLRTDEFTIEFREPPSPLVDVIAVTLRGGDPVNMTQPRHVWNDPGGGSARVIARELYALLKPQAPSPDAQQCKSCEGWIVWAKHVDTGRPAPIDARPNPAGNILLAGGKYRVIGPIPEGMEAPSNLHTSHFSTCPAAEEHRRARAEANA